MTHEQRFDTQILLALFKTTVEHGNYVRNAYKQEAARDFNTWLKLGEKMLASFEKQNIVQYNQIEEINGELQNIITESRKACIEDLTK